MKIVVLAGGTSTERDVSIVSGTGICGALRQKGHQAILVDVFCGQEEVDWEDPFPAEYDVEKAAAYIRGFNLQMAELKKTRKNFFGPYRRLYSAAGRAGADNLSECRFWIAGSYILIPGRKDLNSCELAHKWMS